MFRTLTLALAALALVLVDDQDAGIRPTEGDGAAAELVLQVGRFAMLGDLVWSRLTHIDEGEPIEVPVANLGTGGGIRVDHRWPPRYMQPLVACSSRLAAAYWKRNQWLRISARPVARQQDGDGGG